MTEQELLDALGHGEAKDWEFKSARGGVPGSLWETYSAMANTDGGTVVLGVSERGGRCQLEDLSDRIATYKRAIFNTANDRGKVSVNLLTDQQVQATNVQGKAVLTIQVPRASRRQRPVYVGQNPLTGTYRRNFEGDYHCAPDEVGRLLADQAEEPADSRLLEHFRLEDLDPASLAQYRHRFSARAPDHPWLSLSEKDLLIKLGGWRKDRVSGMEGLTVAGLLMFGKDEVIRDPAAVPRYQVDYREQTSDDPKERWADRLTVDGTWVANLFQFYQRVFGRLTADLKVPFRLTDGYRKDETAVHEAIREALANAIVHADYRGAGGIVIVKRKSRIEMSNPGTLLVSFEQLLKGGISECRNKSLQLMFQMIGAGEKAGSGLDKIREGWRAVRWRSPSLVEHTNPDRVELILPMVSLLPEASLARLRQAFGIAVDALSPLEVQALVTADLEKEVSNGRMRLMCDEHPTDLTKMLQGLVSRGFLDQLGQKRGTTYRLSDSFVSRPISPQTEAISPQTEAISPQTEAISPQTNQGPPETDAALLEIARPAREKPKLDTELTRRIISDLCKARFLTAAQIASLIDRDQEKTRERFLAPLVREGKLAMRFPHEPNHRDQAYRTAEGGAG